MKFKSFRGEREKGEKRMRKAGYLTLMLVLILMLGACATEDKGVDKDVDKVDFSEIMSKPTEERYDVQEIREYKGMRLDPSIGPRDNSITGIPVVDIAAYRLKVDGLVEDPLELTYDEVLANPSEERLITLYCVEGWDATVLWKGVKIMDLLEPAGVQDSAVTVIYHCVDGYTTSMPLQEVIDRDMLLAYSTNNITLPASLGYPFIVVAEDKLGYKWARWVERIELSDNVDYEGYWEKRGYENEADVPASRN